jgi:hypothetical protein
MGMINQVMQMVQQMQPQQSGESGQASDGGQKDPVAQIFNQAMELAKG